MPTTERKFIFHPDMAKLGERVEAAEKAAEDARELYTKLEDKPDDLERLVWVVAVARDVKRGLKSVDDLQDECDKVIEPGRRLVVTASSWDLDDRQRAMIEAGAHLRVSMWVYPIPPMSVAVEAPFCGCHAEEMVFNDDGGFSCRHLLEVGGDGDHDIDAEGQLRRDFSPAEDDEAEGGDLAGPGAPSDPPQS
jgi:hypothetical protein